MPADSSPDETASSLNIPDSIQCPSCRRIYSLSDGARAKLSRLPARMQCSHCRSCFELPDAAPPAATAEAAQSPTQDFEEFIPKETRPCPFCGEPIGVEATKCKHCDEWMTGKCPTCFREVPVNAIACPSCGTPTVGIAINRPLAVAAHHHEPLRHDTTLATPAGFWLRLAAFFIDAFALVIILLLADPLIGLAVGGTPVETVFSLLVEWLYFALMERSAYQGTLGKILVGLIVTDVQGHRISFWRATGRYWAKMLSALTFGIGFIVAGFTERKQALHDLAAGTLVYRTR